MTYVFGGTLSLTQSINVRAASFVLRSRTQSHNVSKSRTRHRQYSDGKPLQLGSLAKSALIYIFYWTSDRSVRQALGTRLHGVHAPYNTQNPVT